MNLQSLFERVEKSKKNYNDIISKMTICVLIRILFDDPSGNAYCTALLLLCVFKFQKCIKSK